jgi:hypothetical protein
MPLGRRVTAHPGPLERDGFDQPVGGAGAMAHRMAAGQIAAVSVRFFQAERKGPWLTYRLCPSPALP